MTNDKPATRRILVTNIPVRGVVEGWVEIPAGTQATKESCT